MLVKGIMTRTSAKFYENDFIEETAKKLLRDDMKGGLVYSLKGALKGTFSERDLLKGLINGKKTLEEIYNKELHIINENDDLKIVQYLKNDVLPVQNKNNHITGFITKEQYLTSYLKVTKVELSHLDAIFDSAHNGILSIDQEGKITSINPAAERMALTKKKKAIGSFLTDIVHNGGLLRVVRTGKGHSEKYKVGNRMYLSHRTPIFDGEQLVGAVGVFQDISEIEFMADELESVKQLLKEQDTIFNNSSDGICIMDKSGKIIKRNKRFIEIFPENQLSNQVPVFFKDIVMEVSRKGKPFNVMRKNQKNQNSLIISAVPLKNSRRMIERIVLNVKDITEIDALRNELEKAKFILENVNLSSNKDHFIANSPEMIKLIETVYQVAKVDVTVLLYGESGVGKEEIAKLIQRSSNRANHPFVKVNCGAIPESLMESELFGYDSGAFTGALKGGKAGLFEQANNGTLFLDEIGEIPLQLQVKLLRVLQEMEITRVGGSRPIKVDVRVIAATNRNLQDLVTEGTFREDLFYRLNVIPIYIPPLRKRTEDIPLLIERYASIFSVKYNKHLSFSKRAISSLIKYKWPGNVRELVNILERLYVTTVSGEIQEEDVLQILYERKNQEAESSKAIIVNQVMPLKEAIAEVERELIRKASLTEHSYRGIARLLDVNPSTIVRKVKNMEGDLKNEK
ncbi:sigma 54-interacting transcriptional regulator [Calidifontibacillus oryziterrae]|uniref:sigma 54-interacting transcriptional regulator n=1 Tax=Calidifontibacillus oryziterrae TaxID=1191699 RepID=UPI00031B903E|nr:sigma 54-interacting transcriptional regulator [Calidifontibacillus oryziterrae]